MERKGLFFTVAVVLLIIPLILFVAYHFTVEKTKRDDTINKIRCDELHYFVEDIRGDLQRAMVIFGRRAAIYAIDDVVSKGAPLRDYGFECSSVCHLDCDKFSFDVNGSEAAMAELILCGTLHGENITYMVNHTLAQWLDRIESQGRDMHFNVSIRLTDLHLAQQDPWTFVMFVNTTFNVYDESRTCFYVGSNVATVSSTSIIGLEDPLFPLNTRSFVVKYIYNCSTEIKPELIAGCSAENLGNGSTTGYAVFYSQISAGDKGTYCSDNYPEVNQQILVMDTAFGASPCQQMEQCCFNMSCPNHFAGAINYDVNRVTPFIDKCDMTIAWITGTGDMDDLGPDNPGWARPPGCDLSKFTTGDCIEIRNNGACTPPIHQVIVGLSSDRINTSCYQASNASLYGGYDGPSFFDRLEGRFNLSERYVNQSLMYFNNSQIGMETLINPYYIEQRGVRVEGNRTWADYLYWTGVYGCPVKGACPSGKFVFRLDDVHAKVYDLDTICINVTGCPGSTEVCVNGLDEDIDGQPDWLDFDCIPFFAGCGQIQACDPMDLDSCATCDLFTPPELPEDTEVGCQYYGYNTSEWHFYSVTPSQSGMLSIVFNGTSNATGNEKTDLIIYNYSIEGDDCVDPEVRLNMELDSSQDYCVIEGETYVLGLDVDAPRFGYNGSYKFGVYLTPGDPSCPTPSTSTSTTTTSTTTTTTMCGFYDELESGVDGWTHGGPQDEWELGTPDWGGAYSGVNCWATDLAPNPLDLYENNANEWLMTPPFDLSNAASATLYFQGKYNTEDSKDYCYVEASADGAVWNQLASYTKNQNNWQEFSYSLNSYAGDDSVWVRFRLQSDSSIVQEGFYIDDVNVSCS